MLKFISVTVIAYQFFFSSGDMKLLVYWTVASFDRPMCTL